MRVRIAALAGLAAASSLLLTGAPAGGAAPPNADYGDAPDGANASYSSARRLVAGFPSLRASNGPRHNRAKRFGLGVRTDREADSRQVDRDQGDDGYHVRLDRCQPSRAFFVVDATGLPSALRTSDHRAYLNAWMDWDRNGRWRGRSSCGGKSAREWWIRNRAIDMSGFDDRNFRVFVVRVLAGPAKRNMWMRASLTLDEKHKASSKGRFDYGETEDYLLHDRLAGTGKRKPASRKPLPDDPPDNAYCDPWAVFLDHAGPFRLDVIQIAPADVREVKVTNAGALPGLRIRVKKKRNIWIRALKEDPPRRIETFQLQIRVTTAKGNKRNLFCFVQVFHDELDPVGTNTWTPAPDGGGGGGGGGTVILTVSKGWDHTYAPNPPGDLSSVCAEFSGGATVAGDAWSAELFAANSPTGTPTATANGNFDSAGKAFVLFGINMAPKTYTIRFRVTHAGVQTTRVVTIDVPAPTGGPNDRSKDCRPPT